MGYIESKWVAERLLEAAADQHGLNTTIIRVGQLSGAENGFWKTSEWVPTLTKFSHALGCFPTTDAVSIAPHLLASRTLRGG